MDTELTPETAAGWLAGFVDGEGCVYQRDTVLPNGKRSQIRVLTITNTDRGLMDFAARCFDLLGIGYNRLEREGADENRKYRWIIDIRKGADLERFRLLVPIQAAHKRARLDKALESYGHLRCRNCNCLHDEKTPGCLDCRKRHQMRIYAQKHKEKNRVAGLDATNPNAEPIALDLFADN